MRISVWEASRSGGDDDDGANEGWSQMATGATGSIVVQQTETHLRRCRFQILI